MVSSDSKQFGLLVLASIALVMVLSRAQNWNVDRQQGTRGASVAQTTAVYTNSTKQLMPPTTVPTAAPHDESFDPQDTDWPKLDTLIGDRVKNVKRDVDFMLDFAIVGHPKCATTFFMAYLASQQEIAMPAHEIQSMSARRPAEMVATLYELDKDGYGYKRGYKAPRDIVSLKALSTIREYFPTTRLIVGLRHPVLWFESFYNYRLYKNYKMPPAEQLFGPNRREFHGVCTGESKFHIHLDHLRKTERTASEKKLLSYDGPEPQLPRMNNPVFLYEINQLHDENATRAEHFLRNLEQFIGLKQELEPIHVSSSSTGQPKKEKKIDICNVKYRFIRAELMKNAVEASKWIREYFLQSPDVVVSSPEYFDTLLKTWLVDPCALKI